MTSVIDGVSTPDTDNAAAAHSVVSFLSSYMALTDESDNKYYYSDFIDKNVRPTSAPEYSGVDWLSCTIKDIKKFHTFAKYSIRKFKALGLVIHDTGRGRNGYDFCFSIMHKDELCGSYLADGSGRMGGMFELTGYGCKLLMSNWSEWCKLIFSLKDCGFCITRLDVCTDLRGEAWNSYSHNIVDFLHDAGSGMFAIGIGGGTPPVIGMPGDWYKVSAEGLDSCNYNPVVDCPSGLSVTIGKRSGANSFVIYEKGKEQFGKGMVPHLSETDARWIRVERRYGRGTGRSRVSIPFDFALMPDRSLTYNCKGFEAFMSDYYEFKNNRSFPNGGGDDDFCLERIGYMNSVSLLRKAFHGAQSVGRLVRTMVDIGMSHTKIVSVLMGVKGIKGYVDDISMVDIDEFDSKFREIKWSMINA